MNPNPYVKFIIESLVKAMDEPKDHRKQKKKAKKDKKQSLLFTWFGMIPYAFSMSRKRKKNREEQLPRPE